MTVIVWISDYCSGLSRLPIALRISDMHVYIELSSHKHKYAKNIIQGSAIGKNCKAEGVSAVSFKIEN